MHARVVVQRKCCSLMHGENAHTDIPVLKTAQTNSHAVSEAEMAHMRRCPNQWRRTLLLCSHVLIADGML